MYIKNNMLLCKVKDNRQRHYIAKIEVTNEEKAKVRFNELNIAEPKVYAVRDYVISVKQFDSKNQLIKIISK